MSTGELQKFIAAEHLVEERSGSLRKVLPVGDLVLLQVLYITGFQWLGDAAKLGSAHIMYWIPAVLLFYIPSGIVVIHLNAEMPLEGGLYQWVKLRFGPLPGFLIGLNFCAGAILIVASGASLMADNIGYAMGPSGSWIVESKVATVAINVLLMGMVALLAVRGLSIAKWFHNFGGLVFVLLLAGMIAFALPRWMHGTAVVAPVAATIPALTLLNLNIAGRMGMGAFGGIDSGAIFSGEVRSANVARIVRRSILLAGPLIALS